MQLQDHRGCTLQMGSEDSGQDKLVSIQASTTSSSLHPEPTTSPVIFLINKFLKLFSAPLKIWCLVSCFVHSKTMNRWMTMTNRCNTDPTQPALSPCSATVFLLPLSWGYVIQKLSHSSSMCHAHPHLHRQYGSLPFYACFLLLMWHLFLQKVTPEPRLGGPLMCTENLSHFLGTKIILPYQLALSYSFN